MIFRILALSFLILAPLISGCRVMYSKRIQFKNHPIALRVESKVIDEETIDYVVKFRNTGREILTFDYTIADEPGVPHVDCSGPNSGYIPNLYPGAEIEVKNPTKKMAVWVTLGTVSYGKRTPEDLAKIYKPGEAARLSQTSGGSSIFPGPGLPEEPAEAAPAANGNAPLPSLEGTAPQ